MFWSSRRRLHRVLELRRLLKMGRGRGMKFPIVVPMSYKVWQQMSEPFAKPEAISRQPLETRPVTVFLLLFVGVPLIELYFLIQVGSEIGALPTIGLSIFTALLGGALVRIQGFSVLMRVRDAMARNQVPALEMLDGALLLVAGLVLLLPGFFTDILGFLLLVPVLRRLLMSRFVHIVPNQPPPGQGQARNGPRTIEGEFRRERD